MFQKLFPTTFSENSKLCAVIQRKELRHAELKTKKRHLQLSKSSAKRSVRCVCVGGGRTMDEEHFLVFERFKFHHQDLPVPGLHKQHRKCIHSEMQQIVYACPAFVVFSFSAGFSVTSYSLKQSFKVIDTSSCGRLSGAEWVGLGQ